MPDGMVEDDARARRMVEWMVALKEEAARVGDGQVLAPLGCVDRLEEDDARAAKASGG